MSVYACYYAAYAMAAMWTVRMAIVGPYAAFFLACHIVWQMKI